MILFIDIAFATIVHLINSLNKLNKKIQHTM